MCVLYDHMDLNFWSCLPCHIFGTTACPTILTFPEQAGEAGKMRQVWEGEWLPLAVPTNVNSSKKARAALRNWGGTETHRPRAAGAGLALRNNQASVYSRLSWLDSCWFPGCRLRTSPGGSHRLTDTPQAHPALSSPSRAAALRRVGDALPCWPI